MMPKVIVGLMKSTLNPRVAPLENNIMPTLGKPLCQDVSTQSYLLLCVLVNFENNAHLHFVEDFLSKFNMPDPENKETFEADLKIVSKCCHKILDAKDLFIANYFFEYSSKICLKNLANRLDLLNDYVILIFTSNFALAFRL